jgi:hypothetical protein
LFATIGAARRLPATLGRFRTTPLAAFDNSGLNVARMPFDIVLAPEAIDDLRGLRAPDRATLKEALETHLRHEPTKVSRSRIKLSGDTIS